MDLHSASRRWKRWKNSRDSKQEDDAFYIQEITEPLIRTLEKFCTLHRHQLGGHFANLEFWLGEVEHRFAAIDGYRQRFERMKSTQLNETPFELAGPPIRRGIKDSDLKDLRRKLSAAAFRFFNRCLDDNIINKTAYE